MRRPALALLLAGAVLAGCGGPTDEERVRDTVTAFGQATAAKDYRRLCERLWAALTEPAFTRRYWQTHFETDWAPGSPMVWHDRGAVTADPEQARRALNQAITEAQSLVDELLGPADVPVEPGSLRY